MKRRETTAVGALTVVEWDRERMRGSLHADLATSGLDYDANRTPSGMRHLTADYMEGSAAKGPRPQIARTCEITVLVLANSLASATIVSESFLDYLHLAGVEGPELPSEWTRTRSPQVTSMPMTRAQE